ncbi:uncharacterized protein [Malus domestica]|uniref:uncharacterized protein isoform X2 n=1 Tax=Malus domestica TaxID=3750 RepID=UPI003976206C
MTSPPAAPPKGILLSRIYPQAPTHFLLLLHCPPLIRHSPKLSRRKGERERGRVVKVGADNPSPCCSVGGLGVNLDNLRSQSHLRTLAVMVMVMRIGHGFLSCCRGESGQSKKSQSSKNIDSDGDGDEDWSRIS